MKTFWKAMIFSFFWQNEQRHQQNRHYCNVLAYPLVPWQRYTTQWFTRKMTIMSGDGLSDDDFVELVFTSQIQALALYCILWWWNWTNG